MYWSDWGAKPEIAKANMDGSQDISFVSNSIGWPNGLAIDSPNERLYWTDAKQHTIESIKLDGTDRRVRHLSIHSSTRSKSPKYFFAY